MVKSQIDFRLLKSELEETISAEGQGIGEREFAWVYRPNQEIELIPERRGLCYITSWWQ